MNGVETSTIALQVQPILRQIRPTSIAGQLLTYMGTEIHYQTDIPRDDLQMQVSHRRNGSPYEGKQFDQEVIALARRELADQEAGHTIYAHRYRGTYRLSPQLPEGTPIQTTTGVALCQHIDRTQLLPEARMLAHELFTPVVHNNGFESILSPSQEGLFVRLAEAYPDPIPKGELLDLMFPNDSAHGIDPTTTRDNLKWYIGKVREGLRTLAPTHGSFEVTNGWYECGLVYYAP